MDNNSDYRLLTLSDVEPAARVLSQAFVEDPLCAFKLPFERTRAKTLHIFFRAYGEMNIKKQRGYGIGEPLRGVAYWKFPNQAEISISAKSLSIFIPLLFTVYPIRYFRARAMLKQIDALHQKHADEAHFYLDNIGVSSSARGTGVSSKLIRPFLDKADSEKVSVYTDTVTRSNMALYEHSAFSVWRRAPLRAQVSPFGQCVGPSIDGEAG